MPTDCLAACPPLQGRLKSLYSTFRKMARKGVPLSQVFDARALRVIVDDEGGRRQAEAIAACYKLLPAVHRLFRRVAGEEDDYIAQPKVGVRGGERWQSLGLPAAASHSDHHFPTRHQHCHSVASLLPQPSGYQSLHTAVIGPGGVPMEVQMRSSSMHSDAEYGEGARHAVWVWAERSRFCYTCLLLARHSLTHVFLSGTGKAAHWCYKEKPSTGPGGSQPVAVGTSDASLSGTDAADDLGLAAGQAMLHIGPGGRLRDAVVVHSEFGGRRLLCAVAQSTRVSPAADPAPEDEYRYGQFVIPVRSPCSSACSVCQRPSSLLPLALLPLLPPAGACSTMWRSAASSTPRRATLRWPSTSSRCAAVGLAGGAGRADGSDGVESKG